MIDALFGSKTRVKLLHLFLSNPGQSFYVREITRKIDEQINSVRRELSNMLDANVITSDSANNKLYYQVNKDYEHYQSLKTMFGGGKAASKGKSTTKAATDFTEDDPIKKYTADLEKIAGLRMALFTGVLIGENTSPIDVLFVGNLVPAKVKAAVSHIEKLANREIRFSVLPSDEFYYRLSIKDRFISEILNSRYVVALDKDNAISQRLIG